MSADDSSSSEELQSQAASPFAPCCADGGTPSAAWRLAAIAYLAACGGRVGSSIGIIVVVQ